MSSTTELDDVMALLEQVLPDPSGYGKKLLQQFVLQWASAAPGPPTVVAGETEYPEYPEYTENNETGATGDVETEAGYAAPTVGLPALLASALGACDCWGTRPGCATCLGAGAPGWAVPDPDLFQTYVAPAAARLSTLWSDDLPDDEGDQDDLHDQDDATHQQRREGVNA